MNTLAGLHLALKHCTKYEDRMFLQFLIKVEERNAIEEGIKAADEGRVETLESAKEKWRHKRMLKYWEDNKESFKKALQHDDGTVYTGVIAGK